MKYSLGLREILRAKPEGFPEGSGYISSYIPTRVTIQTFSITALALTVLGDQYWKSWFSVLLCLLDNTGKYCPVDWAILESWIWILQCLMRIGNIHYTRLIRLYYFKFCDIMCQVKYVTLLSNFFLSKIWKVGLLLVGVTLSDTLRHHFSGFYGHIS